MKQNNLFKFFVNFFYSIKNIYFPDILPHFKQKKNFLNISKKKSSLDASIFAKKFCSIIAILKKNFILNCVICRENLKKNFSWSRITYLNFLWIFFTQLKIYIFPIYYRILNKKKTFYIFRKKNPAAMLRYSRKIFVQQSLFKIFFYSKLRNMSGKLKKKFSWSRITYLNFLWNFFTQLKIYIFPIYYSILNKKKTFYIFRKKNPASMLRYSRKIFVQ